MASSARKKIGIFTPCYNEEAGIVECYERVRDVMTGRLPQYDYEHLFIDNCSGDRTVALLKEICAKDKRVKVIVNSRNFGLSRSPYYGMLQLDADAIVPVVADLQTPPELIVEFVRRWESGCKMVLAIRKGAQEGLFIRLARRMFYAMIARVSNVEQIKNFIGYGLFDRHVIDILRSLGEPDPYFRGLISEIGFERAFVEYDQPPRKHGKSRHSIFDLIELSTLALTTYSKAPIRIMTITGVIVSAASLVSGLVFFVLKVVFWNRFSAGITPLLIALFFFAAVQLVALGLIGEYVGMVLQYVRRFPLVIEKERVNFD